MRRREPMKIELKEDKSTTAPDDSVVMSARGDYMTESLVGSTVEEAMDGTEKTKAELIAGLLRSGHFGCFEHAKAYFAVEEISRVAMAQVTRHRHKSFDVQSQRYVNFSDKEPVIPPSFEEHSGPHPELGYDTFSEQLQQHWEESVERYDAAIEAGIEKEDARFFLPQATPVNMTFSANSRALMHFFDLRNNGAAQWEAREFAQQVLAECEEWAPITFAKYEKHINNNSLRAP